MSLVWGKSVMSLWQFFRSYRKFPVKRFFMERTEKMKLNSTHQITKGIKE